MKRLPQDIRQSDEELWEDSWSYAVWEVLKLMPITAIVVFFLWFMGVVFLPLG